MRLSSDSAAPTIFSTSAGSFVAPNRRNCPARHHYPAGHLFGGSIVPIIYSNVCPDLGEPLGYGSPGFAARPSYQRYPSFEVLAHVLLRG